MWKTILILGCVIMMSCNNHDKSEIAQQEMPVSVAYPQIDSVLLQKTYPGYLSAFTKVDLVARVSGFLQKINYNAGDFVKAGQVLFVIEPSIYKDAVAQAQAMLESAISQKVYAENNYNSIKEASKSSAVSQIDLVQADAALKQAIAGIANNKAALETAKSNLGYCYVKAPFSGHITKASFDIGNYLNGSTAITLATVYSDQKVYVNFSIEDSQYLKMLANQKNGAKGVDYSKVKIVSNGNFSHEYYGKIDYLAPVIELSTGTLSLRAIIDNKYGELKSGMYVSVSLPYEELKEAVLVKDESISTDQLGKFLYVVNDSNKVVYTPVTVGDLYHDSLRIITKGIAPKQRYVTKALLKVRDGMTVKPIL